jgi:hypothetical protein
MRLLWAVTVWMREWEVGGRDDKVVATAAAVETDVEGDKGLVGGGTGGFT